MQLHRPLVAFIVLLVVHSLVSVAAYQSLTKTTRKSLPFDPAPVDVTTAEQRARGETVFQSVTGREEVTVEIPWSVRLYVIFGYAALAVTLIIALVVRFRASTES